MTLDDFIVQNASRPRDDTDFLRIFGAAEVYFKVDEPSHQLKSSPVKTADRVFHMQAVKMKVGNMALFFTSRDALEPPFGAIPLMKAVRMVYEMPGVDGLRIQGTGDAWFAVTKDGLKATLANQHLSPTLNEYIIRHAGEPVDMECLRKFASTEVFFRVKALERRFKLWPASTSPAPPFYVQVTETEIGNAAMLWTFKDKLPRPFRRMPLMQALETLYHVPDANGLLIHSTVEGGFVIVNKDELKNFLDKEGISTRP